MLYIYDFVFWAWTLKHIIDEMFCVERGALEHMSIYICVEREALEHMSFATFVLIMKLWST